MSDDFGRPITATVPREDRRGWAVVALMLIGAAVGGVWGLKAVQMRRKTAAQVAGRPEYTPAGLNCKLTVLPGWKQDERAQGQLGAQLVLKREQPRATLVFWARDFGTRMPRAGELVDEATRKLQTWFAALESEPPVVDELGGQPARVIVFQGREGERDVAGECITTAHAGVAYWIVGWSPGADAEEGASEQLALRETFTVLAGKADWTPVRRPLPGKALPYSLSDEGETWEVSAFPATDFDPLGDLALLGREAVRRRSRDRQQPPAEALVLVLPGGDAVAGVTALRGRVEEKQKATFPESAARWADEPKVGPVGAAVGATQKGTVGNGPGRERFFMLAAVPRGDKLLGIVLECDASRRSVWEAEFDRLLGSLRFE